MKKYFNSLTRRMSLAAGAFAFIAGWLCFTILETEQAVIWALLLAVSVALVLSLLLPVQLYFRDKRYNGIEKELAQPVLLKTNVSIRSRTSTREGYLYLTEDHLYLFARDKKPYASQELSKSLVQRITVEGDILITLQLTDKTKFAFIAPESHTLLALLRQHGWNIG